MNDDYDNDIAPLRIPIADDASYSEAMRDSVIPTLAAALKPDIDRIMATHTDPLLTVDELIQAMRNSGSLADVRKRLEKLRQKDPASYNVFCKFYGGTK
jgi:hypothetical protein